MPHESIVRDEDGNPTHIRVTSDDGRESTLHEYDDSLAAIITQDHKGKPIEVATHKPDGKTDAFVYEKGIIRDITGDHRGEQKNGSSGPCFLTTACVEFAGLPDDCRELTTLRQFRDRYVAHLPDGESLISEYYATAPGIVRAIQNHDKRSAILSDMLTEIRAVVTDIESGSSASAVTRYRTMFERLKPLSQEQN
ncbi:MAG: hypothetical protein LBM92_08060 [Opitutaceae bacterium]|jgi:hypothetical protein|nr:hypothetical protein [Opitutaceae bacterium]